MPETSLYTACIMECMNIRPCFPVKISSHLSSSSLRLLVPPFSFSHQLSSCIRNCLCCRAVQSLLRLPVRLHLKLAAKLHTHFPPSKGSAPSTNEFICHNLNDSSAVISTLVSYNKPRHTIHLDIWYKSQTLQYIFKLYGTLIVFVCYNNNNN